MFRLKKILHILIAITILGTIGILLKQKKHSIELDKAFQQEIGWQERAPRSLSGDYESNAIELKSTATPSPSTTSNRDLFISVKTTVHYHQARLPIILKTWFQLAPQQIWFFTDTDDEEFQTKTHGHMINTNCSSTHNRKALCCKMAVEFDTFLESNKKWFCHFDDDNYVNVKRLMEVLSDYSPQEDWYLGKPSIRTPLEILNREPKPHNKQNISFWFATGGAGFCLSRALALKMMPIASGGRFMGIGEKIRLPDDVTMGYIIEYLLKKPLTVIDQFHSHLEPMKFIRQETFHEQISNLSYQNFTSYIGSFANGNIIGRISTRRDTSFFITFSYSKYSKDEMNVVRIDGFDTRIDPTRFLSLHCFLFPHFKTCPR